MNTKMSLSMLLLGKLLIIPSLMECSTGSGNGDPEISVTSPLPGEEVAREFEVRGEGRSFENQINFRVRDGGGKEVLKGKTLIGAGGPGEKGPFSFRVEIPESVEGGDLTLEVFSISPKDGSETNRVAIPLKYRGR